MLSSKVRLRADASAAAGPKGPTTAADTDIVMTAEVLSYPRSRGFRAPAFEDVLPFRLFERNEFRLPTAPKGDLCALCQGAAGVEIPPAFTYVPGEPLDKYIEMAAIDSAPDVEVHGKQGKPMMKSCCYQLSPDLHCTTCHDVHRPKPELATLSQHCLSCHKVEASAMRSRARNEITNYIDCRMPLMESNLVELEVDGKKIKPRLRSLWIKIYSEMERR